MPVLYSTEGQRTLLLTNILSDLVVKRYPTAGRIQKKKKKNNVDNNATYRVQRYL